MFDLHYIFFVLSDLTIFPVKLETDLIHAVVYLRKWYVFYELIKLFDLFC